MFVANDVSSPSSFSSAKSSTVACSYEKIYVICTHVDAPFAITEDVVFHPCLRLYIYISMYTYTKESMNFLRSKIHGTYTAITS